MMKKTKKSAAVKQPLPEMVIVLRTCAEDGTSSHGFKWPMSGIVEAPDWKPTPECGHGLHGWLWGCGDWSLKVKGDKIKWLVLEVEKSSIVDLNGKVKFPKRKRSDATQGAILPAGKLTTKRTVGRGGLITLLSGC